MSAPRIEIINALFDSYLAMRNENWHLFDETSKEITPPTEEKAKKKYEIVTGFIRDAAKCRTTQDWISFSARLYDIEKQELATYNSRSFLVKPFLDWPMLELTFKAIRAYIYSQVKNDQYSPTPESQGFMSNPEARNEAYHHDFFTQFIKMRDQRGLAENSFQEFADNVMSGNRKSTIVDLLSPQPLSAIARSAASGAARRSKGVAGALRAAEESRADAAARSVEIDKLIQAQEQERVAKEKADAEKAVRLAAEEQARLAAESERAEKAERARLAAEEKAREEKNRLAAEEKARRDAEKSRAQRSYADVAAKGVVATDSSGAVMQPARTVRTRRQSVNFADGGPTLFASALRDATPVNPRVSPTPMDLDDSTSTRETSSVRRRGKTGRPG